MRRDPVLQPLSWGLSISSSWPPIGFVLRLARGLAAPLLIAAALGACAVGGMPGPQVAGGSAPGSSGREQATGALPRTGAAKSTSDSDTTSSTAATPRRSASAKVALLLPMSGPGQTAVIAKAMKQAGELALFDHSATDLQLIVKDDKGTPEGARLAAEEAISEGAELILGPLLSASVQAAAAVARPVNVPVIAFSNDRQVAGNGVYLLSFLPEQEVDRVIGYAASQGRRNFAALVPDDAYGRIIEAAFSRAVAKAQANVITVERYQGSGTGMLEPTRRLAEAMARADGSGGGADALVLPGGPETLASLGPLLAYAKLDASRSKLLGSGGWDAPNIGRDQTFVGAWYPAPDQHGWQAFAEKFGKTFGAVPPRIASLAFDAVGIALTLAGSQQGPRYTTASLTRANGFSGADGQVQFQADGAAWRALAILEVQAFGATTIDTPSVGVAAVQAVTPARPPITPPSTQVN